MTTASDIELFLKILFRRKSIKMLKLEKPLFFNFYKKYLEFSLLFVLLNFCKYYFCIEKIILLLYISVSKYDIAKTQRKAETKTVTKSKSKLPGN